MSTPASKSTMEWLNRCAIKVPFAYGLCMSEAALHAEMKRLKVPFADWPRPWVADGKDATVHWLDCPDGSECVILCMDYENAMKHTPAEIVGLLVHEGVHIWQHIVRLSMNEKTPSAEFEAYSVQWIVQELICAFRAEIERRQA